jgi:predicted PurR-regulated permease PerM
MKRPTLRGRLHHREGAAAAESGDVVEIEPTELAGLFAAPGWLRNLGLTSWLLVGLVAAVAGGVVLLELTRTIVLPVITAAIIASVVSPIVDWLKARGVPRTVGTLIVFLAFVALGVLVTLGILGGVKDQVPSITSHLHDAVNKVEGWLKDAGVSAGTADTAKQDASSSISDAVKALLNGVAFGISSLASLAVFLSFLLLSLFFILRDAPTIGRFVSRHMGVPLPVAQVVTRRTTGALRGYFAGVTIVSLWSSLIVAIGTLILGVPLVGTITLVTFLAGYVPYLGAWTAGGFAVLIALGSKGSTTALILAVIILLANGILQQLVQPFAMGAALGIHPLAVLIVTIAGGALFGTIGLILAAPLTAAAVQIGADLNRSRETETNEPAPEPGRAA